MGSVGERIATIAQSMPTSPSAVASPSVPRVSTEPGVPSSHRAMDRPSSAHGTSARTATRPRISHLLSSRNRSIERFMGEETHATRATAAARTSGSGDAAVFWRLAWLRLSDHRVLRFVARFLTGSGAGARGMRQLDKKRLLLGQHVDSVRIEDAAVPLHDSGHHVVVSTWLDAASVARVWPDTIEEQCLVQDVASKPFPDRVQPEIEVLVGIKGGVEPADLFQSRRRASTRCGPSPVSASRRALWRAVSRDSWLPQCQNCARNEA